ncbi:uncharacterized protein MELLADRAFT_87205 [Melampsora larici-populina 98AG31]|uniref:Uncharacterized protein n=1 Tax=Melampsora larici-populina (strain 98AG31 / pathotype 3-4-7) TaxID=747676 RepID=F4R4W8_MELLP|nr:uncharacterized protein MELLADRAFT_87205 [Melampsora larici-populina 98AG31]EGG12878.1 hypothetical protein MELLADRAFT_87205 [Melampsora larici-populina 98AG31]
MSSTSPIQSHIFLPTYLLESVVDGNPYKIDPDLFLSKATTPQLLEVIHAFHPHFSFIDTAQEDRELLKRVFRSMVAFRLSRIPIFNLQPEPHYFNVQLPHMIWGPQDSRTTLTTDTVLNPDRIHDFNTFVLGYLRSGQYRLAAEKMVNFVQTHQYLNEDEISEIQDTGEDIESNVQDLTSSLGEAHKSLEGINFSLSDPGLLLRDREKLEMQLQSAIVLVKSRQSILDHAIQDSGFVAALIDHYQKLLVKHHGTRPPSSPSQDSHQQQQVDPATPSSVE